MQARISTVASEPPMADIPPPVAASSLQAGYHQADVSKARDASRAEQTQAGRKTAMAIDDAGAIIETGDNDTQVFEDAQGTGGQGREDQEQEDNHQHPQDDQATTQGIHKSDDGQLHVDLQA